MWLHVRTALITSLALMCLMPAARAEKLGSEFRVNTYTKKDQSLSGVATLRDGGFVIIWDSLDQDGDSYGVYGQRYDVQGKAVGKEFRINRTTKDAQFLSAVAALADGGFVVVWTYDYVKNFYSEADVQGQRFNAAGDRVGPQFRVNTYKPDEQNFPAVAGLAGGGFVVAWRSLQDEIQQVRGQLYDLNGERVGNEFRVDTNEWSIETVSVAALKGGGFAVIWGYGVKGQIFDAAGAPVGNEFFLPGANSYSPSVAALESGGFLVVWDQYDVGSKDDDIHAQRYDALGNRIGKKFRINRTTVGSQYYPRAAGLPGGGFVVFWNSNDGSSSGVFGQRYNAAAKRVGSDFLVNTRTGGRQCCAAVAALGGRRIIVSWQSPDGSGSGVYGQRFRLD